jgi:hypothetical protein
MGPSLFRYLHSLISPDQSKVINKMVMALRKNLHSTKRTDKLVEEESKDEDVIVTPNDDDFKPKLPKAKAKPKKAVETARGPSEVTPDRLTRSGKLGSGGL